MSHDPTRSPFDQAVKQFLRKGNYKYYYFSGTEGPGIRSVFEGIMTPVNEFVQRNLCSDASQLCTHLNKEVQTSIEKADDERYLVSKRLSANHPLHSFLRKLETRMLDKTIRMKASTIVRERNAERIQTVLTRLRTALSEEMSSMESIECIDTDNKAFNQIFGTLQEMCLFSPLYKLNSFIETRTKRTPMVSKGKIELDDFSFDRIVQLKGSNYFCIEQRDVDEYELGTMPIPPNEVRCLAGFKTQGFARPFPHLTTDLLQYKGYIVRIIIISSRLQEVLRDTGLHVFKREEDKQRVLDVLQSYLYLAHKMMQTYDVHTRSILKTLKQEYVTECHNMIQQNEKHVFALQALSATFHMSAGCPWVFQEQESDILCFTVISAFEKSMLDLKYDTFVYKVTPALRRWRLARNAVRFVFTRDGLGAASRVVQGTPVGMSVEPVVGESVSTDRYYKKVAALSGIIALGAIAAYVYRYELGLATPPPQTAYDMLKEAGSLIAKAANLEMNRVADVLIEAVGH